MINDDDGDSDDRVGRGDNDGGVDAHDDNDDVIHGFLFFNDDDGGCGCG